MLFHEGCKSDVFLVGVTHKWWKKLKVLYKFLRRRRNKIILSNFLEILEKVGNKNAIFGHFDEICWWKWTFLKSFLKFGKKNEIKSGFVDLGISTHFLKFRKFFITGANTLTLQKYLRCKWVSNSTLGRKWNQTSHLQFRDSRFYCVKGAMEKI